MVRRGSTVRVRQRALCKNAADLFDARPQLTPLERTPLAVAPAGGTGSDEA
jgi:hypothetical protein